MRLSLLKKAFLLLLILLPVVSRADEGLWLVQDLNSALEKKMKERGLRMHARAIYDMSSPGAGIADAVVSLGSRYSGVFVSDKGLILTSGRPAIAFLGKIGDVGKDLLKEGFWAYSEQHEMPVAGEKVYSLQAIYDVSEEFKVLKRQLSDEEAAKHRLEKTLSDATGLTCFFHSYWSGERAYVSAYKIYDDVRLVTVPPAEAVNPGGDAEKWSWPVSRCDFSLYRVYEDGIPAKTRACVNVYSEYSKRSFMSVVGFPAVTDRNISAPEYRFRLGLTRPLVLSRRSTRLEILKKWIAEDSGIRNKYSSRAERLEDLVEKDSAATLYGEKNLLLQRKEERDNLIQSRIDKDASLVGLWEELAPSLQDSFGKVSEGQRDKLLRRETLVEGTYAGDYLIRAASSANIQEASEIIRDGARETDPQVEKELLAASLADFFTNMDSYYYGPYQKWIQDRFGYDWDAAAEYLWDRSLLSSPGKVMGLEEVESIKDDPLYRFLTDSPESLYDNRDDYSSAEAHVEQRLQEYFRARYWTSFRNSQPDYPDADSSLRLAYGTYEGSFTTPAMLLETMSSSVSSRWRNALGKDFWGRWGFRVDGKRNKMITCFVSDTDFAEGMEGAPAFDSEGRLVGIVSGGTPAGLASGDGYFEGSTGCVCTDIRFILWAIERYGGLKKVAKEFVIM